MGSARHGREMGRTGGDGDARGLAGYRYALAVAVLAAVSTGSTAALMVGAASDLGYLPVAGPTAAPPSVASPFATYAPDPLPTHAPDAFTTYAPEPTYAAEPPLSELAPISVASCWSLLPG